MGDTFLPRRRSDEAPIGRPQRILFYSHDSFGLGHLRRNLTLAESLSTAFPSASLLIVTGSPCATSFPPVPRVEIVKLPSVTKAGGAYAPRSLGGSLESVLRLRRHILFETYKTFAPDLLIVDHQVVGLHEEMVGVLEHARSHGVRTILGVRDIIDSPERVALEWGTSTCRWALASAYDRICVYGSPRVFDARREYPFPPELGANLQYVGYVVRDSGSRAPRPIPSLRPKVLVTVGGGEDGVERLDGYLDALSLGTPTWDSVILTGPLLDARQARRIRRRAAEFGNTRVHRFHADVPRLLRDSDAVVCMAGYNTCAEVLSSGKPAVYLPRTAPRLEQKIRATRLEQLGLGQALLTLRPADLRRGIERALDDARTRSDIVPPAICFEGASNLAAIAGELLSSTPLVKTLAESLVS